MDEPPLVEKIARYPSSCLADAHPDVEAVGAAVRSLGSSAALFGTARTAILVPGHNAAIHRAVHAARRGEVLVISAGGDTRHGYFGEILARSCLEWGIAGLVIDGAVRDRRAIVELKFPVFCIGVNPRGSGKAELGEIDSEIVCGEAQVRPGDFVVGDEDGVVIVPRQSAPDVIRRAAGVLRREEEIRKRLAQGASNLDIFGIPI